MRRYVLIMLAVMLFVVTGTGCFPRIHPKEEWGWGFYKRWSFVPTPKVGETSQLLVIEKKF